VSSTCSNSQPPLVSQRAVYIWAAVVVAVTSAITLYFCFAPSMAGGMDMPGGWTMSMMWMRMPGQSAFAAALMFQAMWLAMMIAMMLPSALPLLLLYRKAAAFAGEKHLALSTWGLASGYFLTWVGFGIVAYAIGIAISNAAMRSDCISRLMPVLCAAALIFAGIYQLTHWKSACLRHCRDPMCMVAGHLQGGPLAAARMGLHHGFFCALCCWPLMLIQLALGVMNLAVMIIIALAIAAEKLLPVGNHIAKIIGIASIVGGIFMLRHAR
jgi:predicted metal-binding membrane protein